MARLWYNHISDAGAMSVPLTNAEKQARYRERHLGIDGEKMRVGLNLNVGTGTKIFRLARHRGYTITAFVEELVERTERRVTARLPSRALKAYYGVESIASQSSGVGADASIASRAYSTRASSQTHC
jgi:hypothetical protein